MKKEFMEIVKAFARNGVYTLNEKTECVEFSVANSKMLDISDISEDMVFNLNVNSLKAPKITIHDRTMLLLIAKYGVLNFRDLRQAVQLRSEIEKETCAYVFVNNSELKNIIDEKLTNKGLVVRCRIYQEYMENEKVLRQHEYIYCVTAKGINVVNSCMGCKYKDSNSFRMMNDTNTRDKISRMAAAHIALYLAHYGFNVLENHYSLVVKNNRERYTLLMYNEKKNIEVMLQPLYLLRNPQIETEVEFTEKVKTLVNDVFRWVTCESEFEVKGERAERKVVLICSSIMEYNQFCNVLIDYFSLKDYFGYIGSIYATSVGMVDSSTTVKEAFYRHVDIQQEDDRMVPVGGELSCFFSDEDKIIK